MQKSITGSQFVITSTSVRPSRFANQPCWNTRTTAPYAAPIQATATAALKVEATLVNGTKIVGTANILNAKLDPPQLEGPNLSISVSLPPLQKKWNLAEGVDFAGHMTGSASLSIKPDWTALAKEAGKPPVTKLAVHVIGEVVMVLAAPLFVLSVQGAAEGGGGAAINESSSVAEPTVDLCNPASYSRRRASSG